MTNKPISEIQMFSSAKLGTIFTTKEGRDYRLRRTVDPLNLKPTLYLISVDTHRHYIYESNKENWKR